MTDTGWIKLHRKFLDWGWIQEPNMISVFLHLLLLANSRPNEWNGLTINRGQLVTSQDKLSKYTTLSRQTIRTCIERLKSTKEITIESTSTYTIITICNYDKYQTSHVDSNQVNNQPSNKPVTNEQPTSNNKQEYKKERSIYSVLFENFYKAYPRKIGKTQASKSWEKISISEEVFNEIMAGLANYIKYEWKGKEMKYIPHAATWLNQERWKDEVTVKKDENKDFL